MTQKQALQLFEEKKIRTLWDSEQEKWYFSIVDVIAVLTESLDSSAYWRKLKQRLKEEGNETVTNCHGLKMMAIDRKMRMTDVADSAQLFKIIKFKTRNDKKDISGNLLPDDQWFTKMSSLVPKAFLDRISQFKNGS